ncbi:MAG: hypothetical protein NWE99_00010 [Candidatus Bathyarchaeota archaeon]|nr:hypothetical protein [Candidatus Bathyarchaeota archaeon]
MIVELYSIYQPPNPPLQPTPPIGGAAERQAVSLLGGKTCLRQ